MLKVLPRPERKKSELRLDAAGIRRQNKQTLRDKRKLVSFDKLDADRLNELMEACDVLNDVTNLPLRMQKIRTAIKVIIGERQLLMIPPGLLEIYVRSLVYLHESSVLMDSMQPLKRQGYLRKYFQLTRHMASMARAANITQAVNLATVQAEIANEMSNEIHSTDLNAWKKQIEKRTQ